jgi:predicted nucleotidyltransferase
MLQQFMDDLVAKIAQKFRDQIISIALFGSVTTKEWYRGKSDIDFIIIIRDKTLKKSIDQYVNGLIISLDRKYDLQLTQTCSTFVTRKNPIVDLFYRIEDSLTFGKPFFVFSIDQIKFELNTIADSQIRFISAVFDPLAIFLAKMKQTGFTIYGEDLIKRISSKPSYLEKVRAAVAPLWILLMSFISFPFDAKFAFKHSAKATLWACEDSLFALDFPLSSITKEFDLIKQIFGESININHVFSTLCARQITNDILVSKGFVAKHIIKTAFFIPKLYWKTAIIRKKHPLWNLIL